MADSFKIELPHIMRDKDRHGNVRVYVRIVGKPKVRLKDQPGSPAFLKAYTAALDALKKDKEPVEAVHTLGWLVKQFYNSHPFRQLDGRSQRVRESILNECLAEPAKIGHPFLMRDVPLKMLEPKALKVLRDRKSKTPGAANNRVRAFRAVIKWALEAEHIKTNPFEGVTPLKYKKQGFKAWTLDEVAQFETCHPVGTRPRLALALLLFTGVRRSDVVRLGPQHVKNGFLTFTTQKTDKTLQLPILPELREVIEATATGEKSFLETHMGEPFTAAGFGNWFRECCDRAGLKDCSAHGLRKAGATIAAENGATEKQLMAIFGWETARLAAYYSKAADQKKLAKDAMHLLVPGSSG
ncbi:MAG: site-specific integrase [Methylocystis sp.]|jgi:integrase